MPTASAKKNAPLPGRFSEPTAGLEPATPSLRGRSNARIRVASKGVQTTCARCRANPSGGESWRLPPRWRPDVPLSYPRRLAQPCVSRRRAARRRTARAPHERSRQVGRASRPGCGDQAGRGRRRGSGLLGLKHELPRRASRPSLHDKAVGAWRRAVQAQPAYPAHQRSVRRRCQGQSVRTSRSESRSDGLDCRRRAELLRRDPSCGSGRPVSVADVVHQLVATERALDKLAARGISADEPPQLRHNRYVVLHNPRDPERRRFLIGSTDGGRVLTLVIEQTVEPTTWLIVTGWGATAAERRILSRRR